MKSGGLAGHTLSACEIPGRPGAETRAVQRIGPDGGVGSTAEHHCHRAGTGIGEGNRPCGGIFDRRGATSTTTRLALEPGE
ncbi:hypothetical protein [Streptomyces sp. NPDC051909]|uniref:hypothetical protein n=1 Tax=Streptomyces sp. NPDC051909 TaxID=3154944 RepID=UPI003433F0DA